MKIKRKNKILKTVKRFWETVKKGRLVIILSCMIVVIVLMTMILLRQRDIGAREAGLQIEHLADVIRGHYKIRPDYWGLSTEEVIKHKLYPQDMIVSGGKLLGYFNNPVEVGMNPEGLAVMPTMNYFTITFRDLTKDQCTALASDRFRRSFWLGIKSVSISDNTEIHSFGWDDKESVLPLEKSKVSKLCHNGSNVSFQFE